jgi:hypothetical protein
LIRDVAGNDPLRQPLDDRRFTDARLADQRRIVLRPSRQDLHDPVDLGAPPDERSEPARPRRLGQVDAERVHVGRLRLLFALTVGGTLAHDLHHLGAHLFQVHAETLENAGGDALPFPHQSEQQMLGSDVVMVEASRFVDGELDDLLRPGGKPDLTHDHGLAPADDELDGRPDLGELHPHVAQHASGNAVAFAHQSQEKVFGADVVVVEPLGFLLGQRQHLPGALGELVELV